MGLTKTQNNIKSKGDEMKAEFLTDLYVELEPCRDDEIWIVTKHLIYNSALLDKQIVVPPGFETDLASVPRIPFAFWLWGGRAHREGVLHDYLFRSNSNPRVSFNMANRVFLEAMKSRGKPLHVRYPMFYGVCLGGFFSYHKRIVGAKL